MKKLILILFLVNGVTKNYAQNRIGKFIIKAANSNKALDVVSENKKGLGIPTYKIVLNEACSKCNTQVWEVVGSSIKNIATGKYLYYESTSNKFVLQSTVSNQAWVVNGAALTRCIIGIYGGQNLYSTMQQRKTDGAMPLFGFPCATPSEICDDVTWSLQEIEAYASIPEYNFGTLCPTTILSGDREFNGNGPRITGNVSLGLRNNNTEIWATVLFDAIELGGDISHTRQTWEKRIYVAPSGKKVKNFLSLAPITSTFDFVSGRSTSEIERVVKKQLIYSTSPRSGTNEERLSVTGSVVFRMEIAGDTAGDDISNDMDCNDDTRINKLILSGFTVRLENL
jgi:hypothetical protein